MKNATVKMQDLPAVTMDVNRFWEIVEQSRQGTTRNTHKQAKALEALLGELEIQDIARFSNILDRHAGNAYRPDLWAVATIMMDGCCSDDGVYFGKWLVSQGRKHYEAALQDPEKAADGVTPGESVTNELFGYAPSHAYEAKATEGDVDFYDAVHVDYKRAGRSLPRDTSARIYELPWNYDDLPNMYPELWERFA